MMFGGLPISLSIPWGFILQGVGFAFVLCIIMSASSNLLVRNREIQGAFFLGLNRTAA